MDSMAANFNPEFRFNQLGNEFYSPLPFRTMGRPKRPAAGGDALSGIILENIEAGLAAHFPLSKYGNETKQLAALAKRSGVGRETIRRMLKRDGYPRVDILDAVAKAMGASAAEYLRPPIIPEEPVPAKSASQRMA